MATNAVPTPAQIAEIIDRRKKGLDIPAFAKDVQKTVDKLEKTESKVEALEKSMKLKRLSGVELADKVQEVFKRNDFSALDELVKLVVARDTSGGYTLDRTSGSQKLRIEVLKTLVEYEVPKLKSVEVTGKVDHEHNITIIRFGEDGSVKREVPKHKQIDVVINQEMLG